MKRLDETFNQLQIFWSALQGIYPKPVEWGMVRRAIKSEATVSDIVELEFKVYAIPG